MAREPGRSCHGEPAFVHPEWQQGGRGSRRLPDAGLRPTQRPGPHGHQDRLRRGPLRRLHGPGGWRGGALLLHAPGGCRRQGGDDHRGTGTRRRPPSRAGGLPRPSCLPVRVLHAWHDPRRLRPPEEDAETGRPPGGRRPAGAPLPLRDPRADHRRGPGSGRKGRCQVKRRDFLKATGAFGLLVAFPVSAAFQEPEKLPTEVSGYPKDLNAYLRIGPDGRLGCFVGKIEMGQGNMTALAMLAAEELDLPLERVDLLMGDTDLCPWDGGTWGSLSIWQFGPVLRGAAAETRAILMQLAAERLGVPAERLQVKAGVVSVVGAPARQVAYGELVQGKRIERHLQDVKVKPVSQFSLVGKDARRLDGRLKVTGGAKYTADMVPPGTLHACLLRPPAHGARLLTVDVAGAEQRPGVKVIHDGDLVA